MVVEAVIFGLMGYILQAQGEDKQWSEAKIRNLLKEKNKELRMFRLSKLK